jgi:SAM-dependent methyltransferase
MNPAHYSEEKSFWDEKGEIAYNSLSSFDRHRMCAWIGWHGHGRVLDIGGGSGIVSQLLSKHPNTECFCIDISLPMLRHAPVPSVQGDALALPFMDDCFDLVVAGAFFHHLPGLEHQLLREIHRVLRSGGRLVAYDPSARCLQNRLFMMDTPLRLQVFSPDERPVHPDTLSDQLQAAGFRNFVYHPFSFRNQRITLFEAIQRYILSPAAIGPLKPLLERWFFWQSVK